MASALPFGLAAGEGLSAGGNHRLPPYGSPGRFVGRRYGPGFGGRYQYGFGYGPGVYPTYVSLGLWDPYLDFADYNGFDGGAGDIDGGGYGGNNYGAAVSAPSQEPATAQQEYPAQGYPQDYDDPGAGAAPSGVGPAEGDSGDGGPAPDAGPMVYAPGAYRQGYAPPAAAQPASQERVLTLYFRDGRAPERVRNYALTRTAILLPGQNMREIALSELDLPQTKEANRDAGVDFRIP